ncbi:MAG TPA: hypothetical protein VFF67_08995 [Thermoplasmata archaeon]|nr:hypothetical protein [Thermoplasmata archaeon]
MNDNEWYGYTALAIAAVVIAGVLIGLAANSGSAGAPTGAPSAPASGSVPTDYAYLTVAWNPLTGLDEFFPANFTVPANTLVRVTITNYDNGTNPVDPMFARVWGTVGGSETIISGGATTTVSALASDRVSHTFTILPSGTGGGMGSGMGTGTVANPILSVAIPPAASESSPVIVTFDVELHGAGMYTWNCEAPCNPISMMGAGLMAGTVYVV